MISVHKNKVKENMQEIANKIINDFASQPRIDDFNDPLLTIDTIKSCFLALDIFARA